MAFFSRKRLDPAVIARASEMKEPQVISGLVHQYRKDTIVLREALTEALDGWAAVAETDEDVARIAEIRKRHGA